MKSLRIVCLGPGPKFKGGIANFNSSLANTLHKLGHSVSIVSWSQQYPSIIPRDFLARGKSNFLANTSIPIEYVLNYNNPITWKKTAKTIANKQPDIVIVQWSIALQGLPLASVVRYLKQHTSARIIFDLHFVIQKEKSLIDDQFAKPFLRLGDEFITHSSKTTQELIEYFPERVFSTSPKETGARIYELFHPVYSIFEINDEFNKQEFKDALNLKQHVFLFFGFIRKYKGLHNTIRAFHQLEQQRDDVSLLICGESFWNTLPKQKVSTKVKQTVFNTIKSILLPNNNDEQYQPLKLIKELGVQNVVVKNEYIPDEDVFKYFTVSDATVLFYDNSSPSGVESLSYRFGKPILATNVGHFPETIIDGVNGYLAQANNIQSMAEAMNKLIEQPIEKDNIEALVERLSWQNYVKSFL